MKDVNGTGMKRAALLNDYSCFGKCSLSVSVPILSGYGVEAVADRTKIPEGFSVNPVSLEELFVFMVKGEK